MCGIFACLTANYNEKLGDVLLAGIKKLTYRGYDSYGFAVRNENGIEVLKDVGDVEKVEKLEFGGNAGIAHVRWATHGGVTKENAHPHLSCDNSIAIVHNGIIENHAELREELKTRGHRFRSQTDSEVIAHLIEDELKKGLSVKQACWRAFNKLEGSFAVAVIFKDFDLLIGARRESPLIVGVGNGSYYLASDVLAILDKTKDVIFLDEDEMVVLKW